MRGFIEQGFKNKVLSMLVWIAVIYVGFVSLLYFMQRSMLYFPTKEKPSLSEAKIQGIQEITVTTEDGLDIMGWYKAPEEGKPVIIWFHGNGGDHSWREPGAAFWTPDGYGALLAGYRGYAGNAGTPTEENLYKDARAYIKAVRQQGHEIILYGESLGTGIVMEMAISEENIKAVVLEAPYTSTVDVAFEKYPFVPVHLLMKDRYETINKVGQYGGPLLILHGEQDSLIKVGHSKKLFEVANEPKKLITYPKAEHSDLYEYGARQDAMKFFNSL